MKIRLSYVLFALFMIVGAFIAIFFYGYFTRTPYVEPPSPLTIRVADCYFSEVSEDKLAALSLSVASCDGLREIGAVDAESRNGLRPILDEDGKEISSETVTVGEKAYAYPDAGYPNLIVAPVDGEPAIFQFCNFLDNYEAELETVYGPFSPETIDSIVLREIRREGGNYGSEIEVSDKQELTAFCDAYHAEPADYEVISAERGEPEDNLDYPNYSVRINLTNGFSVNLLVYPRKHAIDCACRWYPCSQQLREWFEAHTK